MRGVDPWSRSPAKLVSKYWQTKTHTCIGRRVPAANIAALAESIMYRVCGLQ